MALPTTRAPVTGGSHPASMRRIESSPFNRASGFSLGIPRAEFPAQCLDEIPVNTAQRGIVRRRRGLTRPGGQKERFVENAPRLRGAPCPLARLAKRFNR